MPSWEKNVLRMVDRFSGPARRDLHRAPKGWSRWPEVWGAHRILANRHIASLGEYPGQVTDTGKGKGKADSRGIVICGGGQRYFPCAWVCIRTLRELHKTKLPIELWFLGEDGSESYKLHRGIWSAVLIDALMNIVEPLHYVIDYLPGYLAPSFGEGNLKLVSLSNISHLR